MSSDTDAHFKYYQFEPSLAGASVFAIVFGVLTIWHLVLIAKHRTWYFIPILIGGVCEYFTSCLFGSRNPTLCPYVIQTLLLLVAPALFAPTMYMILGRITISVGGESNGLVKTRWLTKVFETSDVLSFFLQLGSGGLMASSKASTARLGSRIVLGGCCSRSYSLVSPWLLR
ncbi:uncharacterized protein A1O9_06463 [Exophiala aquamarina CBS 119918]|uniref:RTA1 domain-containing protein n=1 Tax=Exophiala aquamarina CBS 119918 TaxID=1182545 RepID=A0A072PFI8_9EURO|nr:uncharacterized protein A1O9_06463 [Exophiala aquamarina CBS 119918]KEF58537.1 hypothetical protein A1O9_06463 [Exophiala aquamarina CBS 119918]